MTKDEIACFTSIAPLTVSQLRNFKRDNEIAIKWLKGYPDELLSVQYGLSHSRIKQIVTEQFRYRQRILQVCATKMTREGLLNAIKRVNIVWCR